MKKILFLFETKKMTKAIMLCAVFFFVGMASVSAQYVNAENAITTLGTELRTLNAEMQNVETPTPQQKAVYSLKMNFAKTIRTNLSKGVTVESALSESEQRTRKLNSGAISILSETEVTAIFNELEEMLLEQ